jgi:hypothetical protein
VIAAIVWRFLPASQPGLPLFSQPTEKHRPALKAALPRILAEFYSNPKSEYEARDAVTKYRRSFADATDHGLMDPAFAPACNVPLECQQERKAQDKRLAAVQQEIARRFAHLPKGSPEQHAAITEALALDRSVPVGVITSMLDHYSRAFPKEAELMKLQAHFFRIIDEIAVPENYRSTKHSPLIYEYLVKYFQLASQSLKPIPQTCDGDTYRNGAPDPAACKAVEAAFDNVKRSLSREYDAYWKSHGSPTIDLKEPPHEPFLRAFMSKRATSIKDILRERTASQVFMRWRMIDELWR